MTKYGRPLSVVPASRTLAIWLWSISARAWRSASNRAMTWAVSIPGLMTLSATCAPDGRLLLGHEDDAHAALADRLQQLVRPDASARPLGDRPGRRPAGRGAGDRSPRMLESTAPGLDRVDRADRPTARGAAEGLDAAAEFGVAGAGVLEVGGALRRVAFSSAVAKIVSSLIDGPRSSDRRRYRTAVYH